MLAKDKLNNEPYAGDVSPKEAWEELKKNKKAELVDVRTVAEWTFIGVPDLSGIDKNIRQISWRIYPSMEIDSGFEKKLMSEITDKDTPIYFLCRSGGRSLDAAIAMTASGYNHCYNIAGGFEGEVDGENHRGKAGGWKAENLPWGQN